MLTGDERNGSERGGKVMAAYREVYGPIGEKELLRVALFDLMRYSLENGVGFDEALERAAREVRANLT